ncbi:GNAT family N-acetyltransferase [Bradyrhizobium jicamae]|uniref:GNAT family N-acetyltransferase n=1 Tax=Bradyrhizobium jicamae TaxID=280332 RepID=A0ABS5FJV3_9BRAD|nr:GNAT family N-acetyltransferase [Bradyrhizobium jicamae]MBR0797070.1 GNAT family N-acetyltransferase [Bradyrhizobium jicamae]MBR0937672.1 GNAT family N-acetyltransferase [Bradyrhizobium jicamae]
MTVLTTSAVRTAGRATARASGFHVELLSNWAQAAARWGAFEPSTAFQHPQWYASWYRAFAAADGVEPLIAVVTDAATGERAALLPLIRRRQGSLRVVEFADLDLTDYNAPLLGPAAPREARAVRRLWRDLRRALRKESGGADLLRLLKMPAVLHGRANPLALLGGAGPCPLNGNPVFTGDDYDAWRYTLEKTVRKELERSWRVFTRDPAARFTIAAGTEAALEILATTEMQQSSRMDSLGLEFVLNDDACSAFYRDLVREGIDGGYVVVTALMAGEEIVATLVGIRTGPRYVMIRISNAGDKWSNCSPGRLIIERTMAALHKDGVREFDFSVGNYAYKRRFGPTRLPLRDLNAALSWRGWPLALRHRAVLVLRRNPKLYVRLRQALGRMKPSREEI